MREAAAAWAEQPFPILRAAGSPDGGGWPEPPGPGQSQGKEKTEVGTGGCGRGGLAGLSTREETAA